MRWRLVIDLRPNHIGGSFSNCARIALPATRLSGVVVLLNAVLFFVFAILTCQGFNRPVNLWIMSGQFIASVVTIVVAIQVILMERKVCAWVQDRIGPNRTGFSFGILPTRFHFWGWGSPWRTASSCSSRRITRRQEQSGACSWRRRS